jgi:hypothetical protein
LCSIDHTGNKHMQRSQTLVENGTRRRRGTATNAADYVLR